MTTLPKIRDLPEPTNRVTCLHGVLIEGYCPDCDLNQKLQSKNLDSPKHDCKWEEVATEIGRLVARKQEAYGDSFGKSAMFLKTLYPDGVRPEQYMDFLFAGRMFDKLSRIANDKDALSESPYEDILGYALLGHVKDKERREHDRPTAPTRDPTVPTKERYDSPR